MSFGVIHKVRTHGGGEGVWANAYANVLVNGWRQKLRTGGRGGVKNPENFAYAMAPFSLFKMPYAVQKHFRILIKHVYKARQNK